MKQTGGKDQKRPQRAMFDQFAQGNNEPKNEYGNAHRTSEQQTVYRREPLRRPSAADKERLAKRKRRRRRAIIATSIVVGLVIALFGGLVIWIYSTISSNLIPDASNPAGSIPSEVQAENFPEYSGKDVVYGLICGIDYEDEGAEGMVTTAVGRTDMIMYLKFNTKTGECNFLQIPRDTFVGEELRTGGTYKINSLYHSAEDENNRMAPLLTALMNQMHLPVDFYMTIDVEAMVKMVDAVFGVEVYVPQDLVNHNPDGSTNVMTQGWHTLMGKDAEYFLRHRASFTDQDIGRLILQRNFYAALFKKMTELSIGDMYMWMTILMQHTTVGGLSTTDIIGLALKLLNIKTENVTFVRPAGNGQTYNGSFVFALEPQELADVLNTYFRPEGVTVPAEELNIFYLPPDPVIGTSITNISTLTDVEENIPA